MNVEEIRDDISVNPEPWKTSPETQRRALR